MQVKAVHKYARISAFKAREVTREIQGKPVSLALDILAFTPLKAAGLIDKTLRSAIANAENNNGLSADTLTIQEAVVGEGPTLKRWRARARGAAGPIHKRTSHIYITLTDEIPIPEPRKRKQTSKNKPRVKSKTPSKPASKDQTAPAASSSEDTALSVDTPSTAPAQPTNTAAQASTQQTPDTPTTTEPTKD